MGGEQMRMTWYPAGPVISCNALLGLLQRHTRLLWVLVLPWVPPA